MGSQDPVDDVVRTIYPGGDTLLICGSNRVKLLVHSIFLTNASKVFAAMLGSNFREGQMPPNGGPREIPLPEDDPFAIQAMCNFLHSRTEELPESISPTELLAVAYAADKYDLVSILKYLTTPWALQIPASMYQFSLIDLWKTMIAAYILGSNEAFHRTTAKIVLQFQVLFHNDDLSLGDIMPSHILGISLFPL